MGSARVGRDGKHARRLHRELIIMTALDMMETDGVERVSARKLAARLGCEAMSLYNYIATMDALYDGVVEHLLTSVTIGRQAGDPLIDLARAYLALAETYPRAFVLVATRRWRTPGALAAAKIFVDAFGAMGSSERTAWRQARILGAYLNGAGVALAAWIVEQVLPAEGAQDVRRDLEAGLHVVLESLSALSCADRKIRPS